MCSTGLTNLSVFGEQITMAGGEPIYVGGQDPTLAPFGCSVLENSSEAKTPI